MKGQTLEVTDISLSMSVGELKKKLKESYVGVPPNKQKLRVEKVGFLKGCFLILFIYLFYFICFILLYLFIFVFLYFIFLINILTHRQPNIGILQH